MVGSSIRGTRSVPTGGAAQRRRGSEAAVQSLRARQKHGDPFGSLLIFSSGLHSNSRVRSETDRLCRSGRTKCAPKGRRAQRGINGASPTTGVTAKRSVRQIACDLGGGALAPTGRRSHNSLGAILTNRSERAKFGRKTKNLTVVGVFCLHLATAKTPHRGNISP